MHPINYSLILNGASLVICAVLSYVFTQPLLMVLALVMQTHALERFNNQEQSQKNDEDDSCIGFTANVDRN